MSEPQSSPALMAAEIYQKTVVTSISGPLATIVLDHALPQSGERVLDVACGTGVVARQAAPRVGPAGTVVAVDANAAMIAVARSLPVPPGAPIDWRTGNALSLPMPDDDFDLVICNLGLQFIPDRAGALREMYRVLRRGGRAAVCVWRSLEHNPVGNLVWGTIARHLNTSVETLNPGFSLGDADVLSALLGAAGFVGVTVTARSFTVREPQDPQFIERILASASNVLPTLRAMGAEERAAMAQIIAHEIGPALQAYKEGDEQLHPMSAQIAMAYKR